MADFGYVLGVLPVVVASLLVASVTLVFGCLALSGRLDELEAASKLSTSPLREPRPPVTT